MLPPSLEELKVEAQKQSYVVVRHDGEAAWRPLKNWKGHSTRDTYYLSGNRVLVKGEHDNQIHWYTLG